MKTKPLGFWALLSFCIGNMVGAGVFLVPSALSAIGSISLYSWLITALGTFFLALILIDYNKRIGASGGPFTYAHAIFGDSVGFSVAYSYWLARCVGDAGMSVALVGYLIELFPALNAPWFSFIVKAGAIWFVAILNVLGIKKSVVFQIVTTAAKIIPLVLVAAVGLFYIDFEPLKMDYNLNGTSDLTAIGVGLAITLWAFTGFESGTIPSEEAHSAKKIKQATLWAILFTTALYFFGSLSLMGLIPPSVLQHSSAPYADGAELLFGSTARIWVPIGAIISILGALNGSVFIQVHVAAAAARKKLFFPFFGYVSRFGTPSKGFLFSATLITLLLLLTINETLMNQFKFIVLLSTFSFLVPYFIVVTGHFYILRKERSPFHWVRWGVTVVGMLYAFLTIFSVEQKVVFYGCLFFLTSFPIYALMKKKEAYIQSDSKPG